MYARAINSKLYDKKTGWFETLGLTNNNQELRQLVERLERRRKRAVESVRMERREKLIELKGLMPAARAGNYRGGWNGPAFDSEGSPSLRIAIHYLPTSLLHHPVGLLPT